MAACVNQLQWQDDIVEVLAIPANVSAGVYECCIQTLTKKESLLVRQDGAVDFLNTARYVAPLFWFRVNLCISLLFWRNISIVGAKTQMQNRSYIYIPFSSSGG